MALPTTHTLPSGVYSIAVLPLNHTTVTATMISWSAQWIAGVASETITFRGAPLSLPGEEPFSLVFDGIADATRTAVFSEVSLTNTQANSHHHHTHPTPTHKTSMTEATEGLPVHHIMSMASENGTEVTSSLSESTSSSSGTGVLPSTTVAPVPATTNLTSSSGISMVTSTTPVSQSSTSPTPSTGSASKKAIGLSGMGVLLGALVSIFL